jgi:hypothetical protein
VRGQKSADENSGEKDEIPKPCALPVITKELKPAGKDGRAKMAKIAGDAKGLVAYKQQGRHE